MSRSYATAGVIGRYTGVSIGSEYDVDYGYDTYGRSSTVTSGSDTFTFGYLANSNLISGIAYPDNIAAANTYESNRNLLTQVKNTYNTNTTISQYDYSNDVLGNRTSMAKSGTAFTQADAITYNYNDRSEVTGADATNNANYEYGFAFDPIGNRLTSASKENGTTVTRSYTSNNLNQYSAITNPTANPTYDFDGNMLGDGTWAFTWDAENRLIAAESNAGIPACRLEFAYDYMSRRVSKKVYSWNSDSWLLTSDSKFVYDGYLQIEELDGASSDAILKTRVWSPALQGLGSEKYLSETQDGTTYYALGDANKNVTEYLDASGNIKAHYELSPFGKTVNATGTMSSAFNYRFSSEYLDVETGLVYYNFRYYTPELGRWLSRDPIQEKGGWNLYGMCLNNSINYYDLLGVLFDTSKHDRARKLIECWKANLPKTSKFLEKINDIDKATDYTETIVPTDKTTPSTIQNSFSSGSTTYIGITGPYLTPVKKIAHPFAEALADELLHAWYQNNGSSQTTHGDPTFDSALAEAQNEVEALTCKCCEKDRKK